MHSEETEIICQSLKTSKIEAKRLDFTFFPAIQLGHDMRRGKSIYQNQQGEEWCMGGVPKGG